MSLFKGREFWSVDLNVPDAFDANSLFVENVNAQSVIFVGSHDGYFRAYSPTGSEPSEYKPSDLLYETLFSTPVLQIGMANLVSGSAGRQLAILHPKSLAVYSVQQAAGDGEQVLSLRHAYQHSLSRSAHSFVTGPFGGVAGRDFCCVQSLDGLLSFFEQEAATFEAQLPDFLLPAPFCYLDTIDAFVFQDANQSLTCFKYEELSKNGQKTPKSYWTHNIGGFIVGMQTIKNPDLTILVLTDKKFFFFNEEGKIISMKIFEFTPHCFFSFENKVSKTIMTLICTEFQGMNVYDGTCLKWVAKIDFLPVCAKIIDLNNLFGIITLLSDSGIIQCIYLGTIPSLYLIPPTTEPEINVVEAEEELKKLQLEITETEMGGTIDDVISLKLTIEPQIQVEDTVHCVASIQLKASTPINNVQLTVIVEPPLISDVNTVVVPSVVDNETILAKIFAGGQGIISDLGVKAVVSYILSSGSPRVLEANGVLPFEIAMMPCPAAKDAPMKITIVTNKPTCPLNELFKGNDGTAIAIGLKFLNSGNIVTIVAAKTSQRYRIQGESLEELALVLCQLVDRLKTYFRKTGDLNLSFGGPLPMPNLFELIEKHYELITRRRLRHEQLNQRAQQYRTIQKKVLASLKDLNPKPTGALYKVLDDTHIMMKSVISELEAIGEEVELSRSRLSAMNRLIFILLQLMTINKNDLENLKSVFNPIIFDGDEQGWLEVQNATLTLLLRTSFAKSSKDQNKPGEMSLDPLSDVSKLCKLFTTAVDRATRGTSLMERAEFDEEKVSLPTVPSVKEWETKEVKLVPAAAKFTDLHVPIPQKIVPSKENREMSKPGAVLLETEATIETAVPEADNSTVSPQKPAQSAHDSTLSPVKIPDITTNLKTRVPEVKVETNLEEDEDTIWDIRFDEMKI